MNLNDKTGLLIDDIPEMRSTVRIQLADAGLEKCDVARNVKEAMERLQVRRYDVIICDYNLGQGADGQQFLELVRRKNFLPPATAFLLITGEASYEHVSTAAEFAPDDYLIKPFTAETMRVRLERIFAKKEALKSIYRHMGKRGDRRLALAACDQVLAAKTRYGLDVLRLKGDLLMALRHVDEALALYDGVLHLRATPWAEVGKARALAAEGNEEEAKERLRGALEAYPNYLAAYDSLALILEKNDKPAAQQVVERALKVAPSTQRQRRIGGLAFENKDFIRAEEAFRRTVDKDRTGFFKEYGDYAGLAKSYAEQGKTHDALATVKDMGMHFAHTPGLAVAQAAVESQVLIKAGNLAAGQAAIDKALAAMNGAELDPDTALEVAQACFAGGRADAARNIIRMIAEDNHEDDRIFARAQAIFAAVGLGDEGTLFLEATRRRMVKLNNDAVRLATSGELDQAIAMLQEAADRLQRNAQIAINTALALLMHIQQHGMDAKRLEQAEHYIRQARRANPEHPRLDEVEAFMRKVAPPAAAAGDF